MNFDALDAGLNSLLGGIATTQSFARLSLPGYSGFGTFPGGFDLYPFSPFARFAGAAGAAPTEAEGTVSGDTVFGTAFGDVVDATVFNPFRGVYGSWGVFALGGDDLIASGPALNAIDGGPGFDVVWYNVSYSVDVDLAAGGATAGSVRDALASIEGVVGGSAGDRLTGGGGANALFGANGADSLSGHGGNDILVGGAGADVYHGGPGGDIFGYGAHAREMAGDRIRDFTASDVIMLSGVRIGQNQVVAVPSAGGSALWLDTNFDGLADTDIRLDGARGRRFLAIPSDPGGAAATAVVLAPDPTSGNDVLVGMAGADRLHGSRGSDFLHGFAGNDVLVGGPGSDVLAGGPGRNRLDGGRGSDLLIGDTQADRYILGSGSDLVAGAPALLAGDTIADFGSRDVLLVAGTRFGPDQVLVESRKGAVRLLCDTDADGFVDTALAFEGRAGSFIAVPSAANAAAATFIIRAEAATDRKDMLVGTAGNDKLRGLGGDDVLQGYGGRDRLHGGPGDDLIISGFGGDLVDGGPGRDLLGGSPAFLNGDRIVGFAWDDRLAIVGARFHSGDVSLQRRDGGSVLRLDTDGSGTFETSISLPGIRSGRFVAVPSQAGAEAFTVLVHAARPTNGDDGLWGTPESDRIDALAGDDIVLGGFGDDRLLGGAGGDLLIGEGGADLLVGGSGHDALAGRGGADVYAGGAGRDFILGKLAELDGDTVLDLAPGDVIVLTGRRLDASAFALERLRGHAELRADANGDGDTDATLLLRGLSNAPLLAGRSPAGDPSYTVLQLGGPAASRAANDLTIAPGDALVLDRAPVERMALLGGITALNADWNEQSTLATGTEWM